MTRILKAMAMLAILALAGCGGGAGSNVVAQVNAGPGRFYIDQVSKTQKATLSIDQNGFIDARCLQDIGTMKYKPSNVQLAMYVSDRQYIEENLVTNEAAKEVDVTFHGTINNDKPVIILQMDDGEQYALKMKALKFDSAQPIRYQANDWGFEYGHEERSRVEISKYSDTSLSIDIYEGCDQYVGLDKFSKKADPSSVGGVAWQLMDGTLVTGTADYDSYGNIHTQIIVPVTQEESLSPYLGPIGPSTTGKLVVYSKDGTRTSFTSNFEWNYYRDFNVIGLNWPFSDDPARQDIMTLYFQQ